MKIVNVPLGNRGDMLKFIKFPLHLYRNSKYYVPHLIFERKQFFDPSKNPFFDHSDVEMYMAMSESGEILGRVSAHVDHHFQDPGGERCGFFGFFDCIDDLQVARALMDKVIQFHDKKGIKRVIGPMSFNTNDEVGALYRGFDSLPFFMMPYNYPYYCDLIEGCAFSKEKDLYAYLVEYRGKTPEIISKVSRRAKRKSGVRIRCLDMKDFKRELDLVMEVYNAAWEDNWGFIPMTEKEIGFLASNLKPIIDPSIVYLAFVGQRPVGFFFSMPDYNQVLSRMGGRLFPWGFVKLMLGKKKIDRIRVMVMGVIKEYRHTGIEAAMLDEVFRIGPEKGYLRGEMSWILEDNEAMNRIISRLSDRPYRTYRVFGKDL